MPLSCDERQGRREAAGGKGCVAVAAAEPFGRFPEGSDEGSIDLIERLPGSLGSGVDPRGVPGTSSAAGLQEMPPYGGSRCRGLRLSPSSHGAGDGVVGRRGSG